MNNSYLTCPISDYAIGIVRRAGLCYTDSIPTYAEILDLLANLGYWVTINPGPNAGFIWGLYNDRTFITYGSSIEWIAGIDAAITKALNDGGKI